ncbi:MAG TPA: molecular chaperone HtpG [Dysgonamonadaceae bacterium]|nr:molecular chaperone HtpG [Dysgonamonadaceae bacterium]
MTQKGKIGVTTDNIFPIIKKFLYSDHEIFLRELVSNAVDATQKLKTISSVGDIKGELGDLSVHISIDEKAGTLTISDRGIGMTAEEIDKYINEIALSSANDFLDKYKDNAHAIIGHFGLGFYSAFMVAKKVEIITKSYQENAEAVKWSCEGNPEYTIEKIEKESRGTDIVLHIDDENKEFLQKARIESLLNKYCKFLPIPIVFGKKQEWKEDKYVDTNEDNVINNTAPAWTHKPVDLKDKDYLNFYRELYPMAEEPLFWIHLNVDYPFNLTGILYFPRIKSNIDLERNKIQLFSNQVFVTDSVEGIVPEFLMLLHGVIDSPDIPLNVSRSYLQSDQNVKKISNHISKKVADRLEEIFKNERSQFEEKWDSVKLFIEYGMLSDERFYERVESIALVKNLEGKHFTLDEYKTLIKENQTDKDGNLVYLYTNDKDDQYTFIDAAKEKGYDVLLMDGQLDVHWVGLLEQKMEKSRFIRVDSDTTENIIVKEEVAKVDLTEKQQETLNEVVKSQLPKINKTEFTIDNRALGAAARPIQITQNEFSRRMKEMSTMQPGMAFYGEMPDTYQLTLNIDHPAIAEIIKEIETKEKEEITQYAAKNKTLHQLIDLALLSNGMLKGEALNDFIKRNYESLNTKK